MIPLVKKLVQMVKMVIPLVPMVQMSGSEHVQVANALVANRSGSEQV